MAWPSRAYGQGCASQERGISMPPAMRIIMQWCAPFLRQQAGTSACVSARSKGCKGITPSKSNKIAAAILLTLPV